MKLSQFVTSYSGEEISVAYIINDGVVYEGKAKLSPEDEPSKFIGCAIAELRANRKPLKKELMERKNNLKAVDKIITGCIQTKRFDVESDSAKVLFHQRNCLNKEILNLEKSLKLIDEHIDSLKAINNKDE